MHRLDYNKLCNYAITSSKALRFFKDHELMTLANDFTVTSHPIKQKSEKEELFDL